METRCAICEFANQCAYCAIGNGYFICQFVGECSGKRPLQNMPEEKEYREGPTVYRRMYPFGPGYLGPPYTIR